VFVHFHILYLLIVSTTFRKFLLLTYFLWGFSEVFLFISLVCNIEYEDLGILDEFAKLRKAIISFIMSVCPSDRPSVLPSVYPSVRMEQLCSHLMDFHEILYLSICWKSVEKIQLSLKSDKNNGYFTWRPIYIFDQVENELFNADWRTDGKTDMTKLIVAFRNFANATKNLH
jgi:hypothetical protein